MRLGLGRGLLWLWMRLCMWWVSGLVGRLMACAKVLSVQGKSVCLSACGICNARSRLELWETSVLAMQRVCDGLCFAIELLSSTLPLLDYALQLRYVRCMPCLLGPLAVQRCQLLRHRHSLAAPVQEPLHLALDSCPSRLLRLSQMSSQVLTVQLLTSEQHIVRVAVTYRAMP